MQAERRFLQAHWLSRNKTLQTKAFDLSQNLPEELQAFRGLKDYLRARKVRDRLVEGAEKNFLGNYKGDAGIWDKLVRAYELESKLISIYCQLTQASVTHSASKVYLAPHSQDFARRDWSTPSAPLQSAENFLYYFQLPPRGATFADVHIGETALQFIRNGEYEIPFLQAQISKQQQQLVDFEKKEAEYSRMALNAQKNHLQVQLLAPHTLVTSLD